MSAFLCDKTFVKENILSGLVKGWTYWQSMWLNFKWFIHCQHFSFQDIQINIMKQLKLCVVVVFSDSAISHCFQTNILYCVRFIVHIASITANSGVERLHRGCWDFKVHSSIILWLTGKKKKKTGEFPFNCSISLSTYAQKYEDFGKLDKMISFFLNLDFNVK